MKKQQKEFEKWANKIIKKYEKVLLLHDHLITIRHAEVDEGSLMEHGFSFPYKTTDIRYNKIAMEYWNEGRKKELEDCIVHEMCHSLTDPFTEIAYERFINKKQLENERERLTDTIANIVIKGLSTT